jgi:hypothetical protein
MAQRGGKKLNQRGTISKIRGLYARLSAAVSCARSWSLPLFRDYIAANVTTKDSHWRHLSGTEGHPNASSRTHICRSSETGWFDPLNLKEHSRSHGTIQATALNRLSASGFAQSSRLRIASSTRASACLASRASASAACARNSTDVSLSSAAMIRELACSKARDASCSLHSTSMMSSRRARSAASVRPRHAQASLRRSCKATVRGPQSLGHDPPCCGKLRPLDTRD